MWKIYTAEEQRYEAQQVEKKKCIPQKVENAFVAKKTMT